VDRRDGSFLDFESPPTLGVDGYRKNEEGESD
jgi:hypothetical protein